MSSEPFIDVRMKGFRERSAVADILRLIDMRTAPLGAERVPSVNAAGRVLAENIVSPVDVPGFARAAMDGFAVRAADNAPLRVVGTALPGQPFAGTLQPGCAVRIMTGAPIPAGADAIVRAEQATELNGEVRFEPEAIPGKHIVRVGEDVAKGSEVLAPGRRLRPQDLGLLAAIGVASVGVLKQPRVAILVTGDELLSPGSVPSGTRIVDSNSPMLAALIARDGGIVLGIRYVADRFEAVREAIRTANADVILVSGGSSVGQEDHAPRAVAELGELAVHGIAMKPGAPAGVGFLRDPDRVAFLLPGNPVSCLCAYDLFAGRAVRLLGGRSGEMPYRTVLLPLAAPLASAVGRVDYVRVRIVDGRVEPIAAGASNLGSTVAADGFVLVPAERETLPAGEPVEVHLYDADPH